MTQKKTSLGRGLADLLGASKAQAAMPARQVSITPPAGGVAPGEAEKAQHARSPGSAGNATVAGSITPGSSAPPSTAADVNIAPGGNAPVDNELRHLPVNQLVRGKYQPRVDMRQEALEELAISIRQQGVIQPIVVRPLAGTTTGGPQFEIVAGERRWRAAQIAGLPSIPAIIRRVPDEAAIAMALIENIQRENLNPLEEARALDRLIREFHVTHEQAAEAVGRSRASVSNLLRLLELAPEVAQLVEKRRLDMGHARALLGIGSRAGQVQAAQRVVEQGLSVRDTEALVRDLATPRPTAPSNHAASQKTDPDVAALERDLTERLGAKVLIQQAPGGKGRLIISYNSLDEFEGVLAHLRIQ